jgi:alpha-D-xyloside xylohydrolase
MKFSDGYWMMRPGVHAAYPVEVYDLTVGPDSMVVHAPTQRIRHRGTCSKGRW